MLSYILSLVCVGIAVYMYTRRRKHDSRLPPGPKGYPVFGNMFDVDISSLHLKLSEWAKVYGDIFSFKLMGTQIIVLNSSDVIHEAMTTKPYDETFADRAPTFCGKYLFYEHGDIGMASYNAEWIARRKVAHRLLKLHGEGGEKIESTVVKELQLVVDSFRKTSGKPFYPKQIVMDGMTDIIGHLFLGDLYERDEVFTQAVLRFDAAANELLEPGRDDLLYKFQFLRHIPFLKYRKMLTDCLRSAEAIEQFIQHKIANVSDPSTVPGMARSLREVQQDFALHGDFSFSQDNVSAITLDMFIAGVNTSTSTIHGLLLIMLNYPDVQTRIQKEIDNVIGRDRVPCLKDRSQMPYTEAAILEITRYMSIVPVGLPHRCMADTVFRGYTIPNGSMILNNVWYVHRDDNMFKDPWTFDPSRFLDDEGNLLPATHPRRKSVMPFGLGKRACPGQVFAKSRIFLFITMVLQQVTLMPVDGNSVPTCDPFTYDQGLALKPKPYELRAISRAL